MDVDGQEHADRSEPSHRTGYVSLVLPTDAPADQVPALIRQLVADQLAASGEIPGRVTVVTSSRIRDAAQRRWFVEYETAPIVSSYDRPRLQA